MSGKWERERGMAQAPLVQRLARNPRWGVYFSFSRTIYILLLFTLGKGFQISIGQVTINLYVHSLGYDLQFVGIFAAMSPIGALLAGVPVGFLADRIGRKPLLILSGMLTPLSLIAIALSTNPVLLIVADLVNGIVASPYWVTNLPLLTENTDDDQRVGALAMNSFLLLGMGAMGALIGGVVPEVVGHLTHQSSLATEPLRFGVLTAAVVVLLPALPLFLISEPPRGRVLRRTPAEIASVAEVAPTGAAGAPVSAPEAAPQRERSVARATAGTGRWALVTLFAMLLIPDLLFTMGEGSVVSLLQLFFNLQFGLPPGLLGVLITLAGLVGGAAALTAPSIVKRFGRLRLATSLQYLSAPVLLVIGFSPIFPLAALAELVRQMLRGLFDPVYAAFAMESVSTRHRATLSGFYSLTWSLGYSLGAVLEGWLQEHVGLSAPFPVGALLLICSATMLRLFFGQRKPAPGTAG